MAHAHLLDVKMVTITDLGIMMNQESQYVKLFQLTLAAHPALKPAHNHLMMMMMMLTGFRMLSSLQLQWLLLSLLSSSFVTAGENALIMPHLNNSSYLIYNLPLPHLFFILRAYF